MPNPSDVNPLAQSDEEYMASFGASSTNAPAAYNDQVADDDDDDEEVDTAVDSDEEVLDAETNLDDSGSEETDLDDTEEDDDLDDEDDNDSDPDEDSEHFDEDDDEELDGEDDDSEGAEEEGETDKQPEEGAVSAEDQLAKLLGPLQASGQTIQARTIEEAIQLQQMGAHFTKRMQQLQPNLRHLKALEQADLLDDDKLNYLIDLSNKDPKAIRHLVQEAGIDVMDLQMDEGEKSDYTANDHAVDPQVMAVQQALESIEHTETFSRTVDVIGKQWDTASKEVIQKDPQIIKDLNEQMASGIFDKINEEVQRISVFGGLGHLSNIEAYLAVGRKMQADGLLDPSKPKPVATTKVPAVKKKDPTVAKKKKAAASTKQKKSKPSDNLSPLAMDDDEYLRINNINL